MLKMSRLSNFHARVHVHGCTRAKFSCERLFFFLSLFRSLIFFPFFLILVPGRPQVPEFVSANGVRFTPEPEVFLGTICTPFKTKGMSSNHFFFFQTSLIGRIPSKLPQECVGLTGLASFYREEVKRLSRALMSTPIRSHAEAAAPFHTTTTTTTTTTTHTPEPAFHPKPSQMVFLPSLETLVDGGW